MNSLENAVVLSVDEKIQIQALDRTQPILPLRPAQIERQTHDFKRNGATSLYAAFDIVTGKVIGRTTALHRTKEFLDLLRQIKKAMPSDIDLHVILDNSSTHKTAEVKKWLKANPRFKMHFTPTSASWLNAVEGWFGQLDRRSICRGIFTSVKKLRNEIHRFISHHSSKTAKPFKWTKSTHGFIDKVKKAKQSLNNEINRTGY